MVARVIPGRPTPANLSILATRAEEDIEAGAKRATGGLNVIFSILLVVMLALWVYFSPLVFQ